MCSDNHEIMRLICYVRFFTFDSFNSSDIFRLPLFRNVKKAITRGKLCSCDLKTEVLFVALNHTGSSNKSFKNP